MFASFVTIAILVQSLGLDDDDHAAAAGNRTAGNGTAGDTDDNPDAGTGGFMVVAFTTLFVSCFAWSWGPVSWVYVSEVFPQAGRGKLVGLATASNWVVNTLLGYVTPLMLRRDGGFGRAFDSLARHSSPPPRMR